MVMPFHSRKETTSMELILHFPKSDTENVRGQGCTGSAVEVEEAACGKLDVLFALAVEIK